jgi:hypothetical protein
MTPRADGNASTDGTQIKKAAQKRVSARVGGEGAVMPFFRVKFVNKIRK